ncbi:MAG: hypothetical protein IJO57_01420 [Bacilli bacterium]|nr:hypothetical protein [Bacilli bacterium]
MIKQNISFNNIIEKKFKILKTSILLDNVDNRDQLFQDYEDTAREIDRIKTGMYEEVLASKMYTTVTLEEEYIRLKELISCIENRINEKNDFIDDYIRVTSNFLDGLNLVSYEDELDDFKIRFSNVEEYLDNCKEIKDINERLKYLRSELEEKNNIKKNNELIYSKLEDELIEEFSKIISKDEYYTSLNYEDIDLEIDKLNQSIIDKETVMNTFISSYEALVSAGISGNEREEYSSYVSDSRLDYYSDLEKKFLLEIYKLVLDKETDYNKLCNKREKIDFFLKEREEYRNNLEISKRDVLEYFVNLCDEQYNIIKSGRYNLEDIENLLHDIACCEERLVYLEDANNREEILDLLEEYNVEKIKEEKIVLDEENLEDIDTDNLFTTDVDLNYVPKASNMVIKIKDPVKINVKNAVDTAKLVMKKVVIVLAPKKLNTKRDKLKEVEAELKNKVNDEKILSFADDNTSIELDTKAVLPEKNVKVIDDISEIKVNSDSNDIKVSTEIFIEEPKEEVEDLFKVTDPFLDDNFIENTNKKDKFTGNMPTITNIGTVKPNSAFMKIQEAVKENDSIILPTLGLSEQEKVDVPIISENYIN